MKIALNTTEQHLKRIQDKLQLLLKKHLALQKENQALKEEINTQQRQVIQYQENMETLKQQVDILKLGSGTMTEEDKKQFEKRINTYLKEIDRCIAMLGE